MFPARGIDKQMGFQSQPPYSSPGLQNVRPFDTLEGKGRGGSRPGIRKGYQTQLGGGAKVNLLSSVAITDTSGFRQFAENFQVTTLEGNGWTAVASYSSSLPSIYSSDDAAVVYQDDTAKAGGAKDAIVPAIDTSQAYTVELLCVPFEGVMGGNYTLWAAMDDTTPDPLQDGLLATLTMVDGTSSYSGSLKHYSGGVLQNTYAFTGLTSTDAVKSRLLWFLIDGTSVKVYVDGTLETSQTITASDSTHKRVGFGLEATVDGKACMVESLLVQYYTDTLDQKERVIMVSGANGNIYKETFEGTFVQVTTDLSIRDDVRVRATDLSGKLYIADHGDTRAEGTDGALSSAVLSAASIADWTAINLDVHDYVVVITNGTGATVDGTYEITSIASGGITLTTDPGDGTCSYHIERGPKVYDPIADTLTLWVATSGLGQVPTGATIIERYRARIVLSGNSRLWYMSRQYNALDWNYGASDTDYSRAVAGQNAEAGDVGQPITAISPHNDDYIIFGSLRQVYILRGDPTYQGAVLGPVSKTIGIVGPDAWTETEDGELIFLAASGVYGLSPGGTGRPQLLSRAIPRSLKNLTADFYQVSLAYDAKDEGVHVFVFQEGVNHIHYWMDWRTKGFFPTTVPDDLVPFSTYILGTAVINTSDVLMGGGDGYVRRFSEFEQSDDGTEITSYVEIGPIMLGDGRVRDGMLVMLMAILDVNTGSVDWSLRTGVNDQAAILATTLDSGTWDETTGTQATNWPKVRGFAAILRLENSGIAPWAMEQVTARIQMASEQRML
jgi:hypothetical protein